ncbi:Protein kinase domain-containing protein, partial [Psidium guajava]
ELDQRPDRRPRLLRRRLGRGGSRVRRGLRRQVGPGLRLGHPPERAGDPLRAGLSSRRGVPWLGRHSRGGRAGVQPVHGVRPPRHPGRRRPRARWPPRGARGPVVRAGDPPRARVHPPQGHRALRHQGPEHPGHQRGGEDCRLWPSPSSRQRGGGARWWNAALHGAEVARGGRPGFAADVWSLGCTVLEIATGRPPWTDVADPISAIHRIGFSAESPEIPGFLSEQCRDFLSKCLRRDPSERWSAGELLAHAFLEDEAPDFLSEETKLKIPNTSSTSVLEQAIWSSTEDSEPCQALLQRSSLNCPPSERIQQLIGEWGANSISPPQMPNWEWDESWVTVRSSESSEEAPETSRRANASEEEEDDAV